MKSIADIMRSNKRFSILGGRTPAENAEYWANLKKASVAAGKAPYERLEPKLSFREHLTICAVPDRIADLVAQIALGVLSPRPAAVAAREWIEGDEAFLLLHGDSGGGKSVAAASVFEAARAVSKWDGGEQAHWLSHDCWFLEAATLARQSYFDDEGKQLVHHLKRVQLLVLDDLGQELMSAPYLATVDEVLCDRFADRRKRTVLTTNISAKRPDKDKPSPFEERYGARVARRIRESGRVVHVDGKS